tara:strand:- start:2165 stop:3208 length:1044 start_codon:yes stop_codon:yes gene_type:complete
MKKLLFALSLFGLYAQAQNIIVSPCDSIDIITNPSNGSISIEVMNSTQLSTQGIFPLSIVSTISNGYVIGEDSLTWIHYAWPNMAPGTQTFTTCISYSYLQIDTFTCCIDLYWNGTNWAIQASSLPSWDCPVNSTSGCFDPGTGNGQYSSLAACQAMCSTSTVSWDCGSQGCYDPGTGMGQYSSLSSCQSICQTNFITPCDTIDIVGQQSNLSMEVMPPALISYQVNYIETSAPDGTILGQDSSSVHYVYNNSSLGVPYDTITTCIFYSGINNLTTNICCIDWMWNGNMWMNSLNFNSLNISISTLTNDKKLLKVVDVMGREVNVNPNTILFYIYDDGTIEKKYFNK